MKTSLISLFLVYFNLISENCLIAGFIPSSVNHQHRRLGFTGNGLQRGSTRLYTGGTRSPPTSFSDFELPDDLPENQGESSSSSRQISSSLDDTRRRRLEKEEEIKSRFVVGDELHVLRGQVLGMRDRLKEARRLGAEREVSELERAIIRAQAMDAEFVYQVSLERMDAAQEAGLFDEAEQFKEEAMAARSALPQFNLEGLWVGKYGEHGYEMVNVTYIGNTLVAKKVTGEKNVPKGEVSFTVDLSPRDTRPAVMQYDDEEEMDLEPIELGESAAKQWGSKYLQRFAGEGQVATEGFLDSQWMKGQLIIVKEYFSFAWLPISHQVFFGRPSAELTMKLLSQSKGIKSNDAYVREYLERCVEETELLDDEMEVSESPFHSHNQNDYYSQNGCFE